MKNTKLVQTWIPESLKSWIRLESSKLGMSEATFLRGILLKEKATTLARKRFTKRPKFYETEDKV